MNDQIRKENAKKSGYPTQPGTHSSSQPIHRKLKRFEIILNRIKRICKRVKWVNVATLAVGVVCILLVCQIFYNIGAASVKQAESNPADVERVVFPDSPTVRYKLTEAERWIVASVVTAEAAGEPFIGKVAVAQCILNACEKEGIRPTEAVVEYKYTKNRPEPTEEALEAVEAVFDLGEVATTETILYFYAPALVYSEWHESQEYVLTIQGHKFFKEAE